MATENDLPKRILNTTDIQTGYTMVIVLPAKGSVEKYAVAELRRFVFEIGRTFGIIQYDKENALKVIAKDLCKTIGGLSMRAAPTGHSQSQGSVGNVTKDPLRSTACTDVTSAGVYRPEVDIRISNVRVVCETCSMADQQISDWKRWKDCLQSEMISRLWWIVVHVWRMD